MAHKVVHSSEIEGHHGGVFRPLTEPLGVGAFKVNQLDLPAGAEGPEHDHTGDGQDEVYVVIGGGGTLIADGEEYALEPGHYVFCSPEVRRQMRAGDQGLSWVGIGASGS